MEQARGTGRGLRILVVEDAFLTAVHVAGIMRRLGSEAVGPFGDLAAAFAAARREQLDGAILDIWLGDGVSYPVADILALRIIPFAFLTGYRSPLLVSCFAEVERLDKSASIEETERLLRRIVR